MASVSDNFDRSNGEIGANWTEDRGDIDIVSNKAQENSAEEGGHARYTASALDSANHEVQATVDPDNSHVGVIARQASATRTFYDAKWQGDWEGGEGFLMSKCISGDFTTLDSVETQDVGSTGVILLTVDGASQVATIDEGDELSDTDSDIEAGQYAGISGPGWGDNGTFDDWSAEDLAAAGVAPTAVLNGPLTGPLGGSI